MSEFQQPAVKPITAEVLTSLAPWADRVSEAFRMVDAAVLAAGRLGGSLPCVEAAFERWLPPSVRVELETCAEDELSQLWLGERVDNAASVARLSATSVTKELAALALMRALSVEHLEAAARQLLDKQAVRRLGPIYSTWDKRGNRIRYPSPNVAALELARAVSIINTRPFGHAVLEGIVSMVMTMNAHAMVDGNGRLGRALFLASMHVAGFEGALFVPIGTLLHSAQGNTLIALRRAQIKGEWVPILRLVASVTEIFARYAVSFLRDSDRAASQRNDFATGQLSRFR